MGLKRHHGLTRYWYLFIKVLIVLVICTYLLPKLVDGITRRMIIDKNQVKPKGNSTFVISRTSEFESFEKNLHIIIKCFIQ
ncbi:MAG: hypothetical protein ACOYVK_01415 [Bacillota bacterium]